MVAPHLILYLRSAMVAPPLILYLRSAMVAPPLELTVSLEELGVPESKGC